MLEKKGGRMDYLQIMDRPIRTVKYESNSKTYSGSYTIQGQRLTVTFEMATKSSLLSGDTTPKALAVFLLSELVEENK